MGPGPGTYHPIISGLPPQIHATMRLASGKADWKKRVIPIVLKMHTAGNLGCRVETKAAPKDVL